MSFLKNVLKATPEATVFWSVCWMQLLVVHTRNSLGVAPTGFRPGMKVGITPIMAPMLPA
ncbi:MAG: hypothetical protein NZ789_04215 [Pseudomonadales bacterium]|nr:hypothetical protein [Pseudomonadales bacterium]